MISPSMVAVGDLAAGRLTGLGGHPEPPPRPDSLPRHQPAAEHGQRQQRGESPRQADELDHRDEHDDLYHRRHDGSQTDQRYAAQAGSAQTGGAFFPPPNPRFTAAPRACAPHPATRQNASRTMLELILLAPRSRSANVIGTSTIRNPLRCDRHPRSIWKQYP